MFWLGAVVSLCYVPGVTGAYIATQWPVLAVVLPFALLRNGPFTWLHGFGLAFVAYAFVHLFFTPTPYSSVFGFWLVLIMALSVWFGTTLETTRELYAGLATGCAVSSVLGVAQYFGFGSFEVVSERLTAGMYVNVVQQGTVLALVVVALASERMWLWMLPLLPGVAVSGSRGAWLALAVGLLGCYVRRLWVFALVGVAGAFYLLTPLSLSDHVRTTIWRTAWNGLTWFGWGPGVFYTILLPQTDGGWFYPEYAHNDALQLAFEYGMGAALLFVVFAFALSRTKEKEWPVIVAFTVAGCYSMPLYMPIASFLALVAVGRILRSHGVAFDNGGSGGFHVAPWRRGAKGTSSAFVSVAPHYLGKS